MVRLAHGLKLKGFDFQSSRLCCTAGQIGLQYVCMEARRYEKYPGF
jgi:hypothetical protein